MAEYEAEYKRILALVRHKASDPSLSQEGRDVYKKYISLLEKDLQKISMGRHEIIKLYKGILANNPIGPERDKKLEKFKTSLESDMNMINGWLDEDQKLIKELEAKYPGRGPHYRF
jgi:hypothetical protein